MEQTLTPPPSFRVLRVCPRPRQTTTITDENRFVQPQPPSTKMSGAISVCACADPCLPASRGRTRTRVVRGAPSSVRTRPQLSIALPKCLSPPPTPRRGAACSPEHEDELIFRMSPVLAHSPPPPRIFFGAGAANGELRSEPLRVQQSALQTLSVLWENHKRADQVTSPKSAKSESPNSTTKSRSRTTPARRTRTGTVTQAAVQHQQGASSSDSASATPAHAHAASNQTRKKHSPQQSAKALLDLSALVPPSPSSPERPEPFLYSFPSFESRALAKARRERAEREERRALARGERSSSSEASIEARTDALGSASVSAGEESAHLQYQNAAQHRPGLMRARKLRIGSNELLGDNDDEEFDLERVDYISRAFRSESLYSDSEAAKHRGAQSDDADADCEGEGEGEGEDASFFSQGASSISSLSEIATAEHSASSLLRQPFPFPIPMMMRDSSSSVSISQSRSRRRPNAPASPRARVSRDLRAEPDAARETGTLSEAEALRNRGRPRTTHYRRVSEQLQARTQPFAWK